jgi:hypothetical protein
MPATPSLPLFYHTVVSLDREAHAGLRLDPAGGYNFAYGTNAVPLSLSEIVVAAAHHPVVFAGAEGLPMPAAMVGYRYAENLLVEADGNWAAGSYIPCYLRSYPFIFIEPEPGSDTLFLGIETKSPLLSETKGEPLFENGQPSALLQQRMALADTYRRDVLATRAFAEALLAADILMPQQAQIDFAGGESHRVEGFRSIDPAKFAALPEETVLAWWRNGYLATAQAILFSQQRWADLLRRAEQRREQKKAA